MNNIKWIFFDIGSTLVDESVAYQNRIERTITDITGNILPSKPKKANMKTHESGMLSNDTKLGMFLYNRLFILCFMHASNLKL